MVSQEIVQSDSVKGPVRVTSVSVTGLLRVQSYSVVGQVRLPSDILVDPVRLQSYSALWVSLQKKRLGVNFQFRSHFLFSCLK